MLSRKVDAKILISNLADGFIESPEKEFPVGKLVIGKYVHLDFCFSACDNYFISFLFLVLVIIIIY